ncbi:hypothetical protein M3Y97_00325000 [Aphelenchoides bicaudatus]|nr:hypothetical protein M3Y97_00325000 [Aphelenchoides bicaudatus]
MAPAPVQNLCTTFAPTRSQTFKWEIQGFDYMLLFDKTLFQRFVPFGEERSYFELLIVPLDKDDGSASVVEQREFKRLQFCMSPQVRESRLRIRMELSSSSDWNQNFALSPPSYSIVLKFPLKLVNPEINLMLHMQYATEGYQPNVEWNPNFISSVDSKKFEQLKQKNDSLEAELKNVRVQATNNAQKASEVSAQIKKLEQDNSKLTKELEKEKIEKANNTSLNEQQINQVKKQNVELNSLLGKAKKSIMDFTDNIEKNGKELEQLRKDKTELQGKLASLSIQKKEAETELIAKLKKENEELQQKQKEDSDYTFKLEMENMKLRMDSKAAKPAKQLHQEVSKPQTGNNQTKTTKSVVTGPKPLFDPDSHKNGCLTIEEYKQICKIIPEMGPNLFEQFKNVNFCLYSKYEPAERPYSQEKLRLKICGLINHLTEKIMLNGFNDEKKEKELLWDMFNTVEMELRLDMTSLITTLTDKTPKIEAQRFANMNALTILMRAIVRKFELHMRLDTKFFFECCYNAYDKKLVLESFIKIRRWIGFCPPDTQIQEMELIREVTLTAYTKFCLANIGPTVLALQEKVGSVASPIEYKKSREQLDEYLLIGDRLKQLLDEEFVELSYASFTNLKSSFAYSQNILNRMKPILAGLDPTLNNPTPKNTTVNDSLLKLKYHQTGAIKALMQFFRQKLSSMEVPLYMTKYFNHFETFDTDYSLNYVIRSNFLRQNPFEDSDGFQYSTDPSPPVQMPIQCSRIEHH